MQVFKFVAGLACGMVILFLAWAIDTKDASVELHEETVAFLLQREGVDHLRELEACYPALITVREDLAELAELRHFVNGKYRSPTPDVSAGEAQHLRQQVQQIRQLEFRVRNVLLRLTQATTIDQP
ncbi:MAG: hypothetical protein AAFZ52_19970 [Bacteroidota bacterium]